MSNQFTFHVKIQGIVKPSPVFETKAEGKTFQSILKSIFKLFQTYMIDGLSKEDLKIFFFFEQSWHLLTESENFFKFITSQSDYLKLQIDRVQSELEKNSQKGCDPTLSKFRKTLSIFSLRKIQNKVFEEQIQTARESENRQNQNRNEIILYTDVEGCLKNDLKQRIEAAGSEFIKLLQQQQSQELINQQNKLKSKDLKLLQLQKDIHHKQDQYNKLMIKLEEQKQLNNQTLTQKQIEECEAQFVQIIQIQTELQDLRQQFNEKSNLLVEQMAPSIAGGINDPQSQDKNQTTNKQNTQEQNKEQTARNKTENPDQRMQKHFSHRQLKSIPIFKQSIKQNDRYNNQQQVSSNKSQQDRINSITQNTLNVVNFQLETQTPQGKNGRYLIQKLSPNNKLPQVKNLIQQT